MTPEPKDQAAPLPHTPRPVPTWFFMRRMPALFVCGVVLSITGVALGVLFHYLGFWTPPTIDLALDKSHAAATGVITDIRFLAYTHVNGQSPWKVHFEFSTPDGVSVRAVGYTSAQAMASKKAGDPVDVEFDPASPERARPAGGTVALLPLWVWAMMLVMIGPEPVAGLLMLLTACVRIRRERVLLARGTAITAEVVDIRVARHIRVGSQSPSDVRYRFQDDQGRKVNGKDRTYHFEWARSLTADDQVAVVYNPHNPVENALWLHGRDAPAAR